MLFSGGEVLVSGAVGVAAVTAVDRVLVVGWLGMRKGCINAGLG